MNPTTWADENLAGALAGLAGTMSAGRIAEELSGIFGIRITRNAVIGRMSRLGLPKLPPNGGCADRSGRKKKRALLAQPVVRLRSSPLVRTPADDRRAYGHACGILDCTGCRWPVTERPPHLFCNAPRGDGPYCPAHENLARNIAHRGAR